MYPSVPYFSPTVIQFMGQYMLNVKKNNDYNELYITANVQSCTNSKPRPGGSVVSVSYS